MTPNRPVNFRWVRLLRRQAPSPYPAPTPAAPVFWPASTVALHVVGEPVEPGRETVPMAEFPRSYPGHGRIPTGMAVVALRRETGQATDQPESPTIELCTCSRQTQVTRALRRPEDQATGRYSHLSGWWPGYDPDSSSDGSRVVRTLSAEEPVGGVTSRPARTPHCPVGVHLGVGAAGPVQARDRGRSGGDGSCH